MRWRRSPGPSGAWSKNGRSLGESRLARPDPSAPPRLWLGPLQGACADALSAAELAWGRGLTPGRRRRYWQSRAALRHWLAGVLDCGAATVPLHSPPGCPPRLLGGAGCVSLSHSGGALLLGFSADPIGVDLEPADRPVAAAALMRRWFPPEEVAQLCHLDPEPLRSAVLASWVLKEAAIKWRQRSLAAELALWRLDHASGQLVHGRDGVQPEARSGTTGGWRWAVVGPGARQSSLVAA
ncbi:4'-phosphopantetheinyl transferase superfamily protein [Cyanobium sp. CH-040]|uniref:4'-phosphopantetheinyl transferase family protein n=1 Tax=Cyanobium sp. CH-040 TaxID=2823708 RepID=UPI0020CCE73E|nr:4'-phosphopantetheinyl transferase superfamily protein [Cyanobium sp. CH-040]MCP9927246.1 4'-phosphopantetheinyl transferase superfamily protein [Cyanobium sp. CH-040]